MSELNQIVEQARQAIDLAETIAQLDAIKNQYLNKKGLLGAQFARIGQLPPTERKAFGAQINQAKDAITQQIDGRRQRLAEALLQKQLSAESIDVSLPGRKRAQGSLHPVTKVLERVARLFGSLGFECVDGPEIETDWFNFTALNMPKNHPARSMHDTFYVADDAQDMLLRTHTSPLQVRYMLEHVQRYRDAAIMPDIRILAPGRVFRVDSDATHSPMFHQVEALWVSQSISLAQMKGMVIEFLCQFFEDANLQVRFRPSYFPFTEPSAEIDVAFSVQGKETAWLEIMGCGLVHPNVLEHGGIDSEKYRGFAFGLGLDRLAMLRYEIPDLRLFFDGDVRFLRQF